MPGTGQTVGRAVDWLKARIPKSKYVRIGTVALAVFVVVSILKGLETGAFWGVVTAAVLFVLSFDPRIGRHW